MRSPTLSGYQIDARLASMGTLEHFGAGHGMITAAGLESLAMLPHLRSVHLGGVVEEYEFAQSGAVVDALGRVETS